MGDLTGSRARKDAKRQAEATRIASEKNLAQMREQSRGAQQQTEATIARNKALLAAEELAKTEKPQEVNIDTSVSTDAEIDSKGRRRNTNEVFRLGQQRTSGIRI